MKNLIMTLSIIILTLNITHAGGGGAGGIRPRAQAYANLEGAGEVNPNIDTHILTEDDFNVSLPTDSLDSFREFVNILEKHEQTEVLKEIDNVTIEGVRDLKHIENTFEASALLKNINLESIQFKSGTILNR